MAKIIKKINRNHVLPEFYLAKAGKRVPLLIRLPVGAVNTGNTQNRLALAIKDYLACKWPCNKLSGSFYSGLPGGNRNNNGNFNNIGNNGNWWSATENNTNNAWNRNLNYNNSNLNRNNNNKEVGRSVRCLRDWLHGFFPAGIKPAGYYNTLCAR